MTCVYAPSASTTTAGDRTGLAVVDDVEAGENGTPSFVTMLGVREPGGGDMDEQWMGVEAAARDCQMARSVCGVAGGDDLAE